MTLCYIIKHNDMGHFYYVMREVYLILQAPSVSKSKYTYEIMMQVHIFDNKAANPIFQENYLANSLINLQKLLNLFYKIDLLLEYQNGKFKQFCTNCNFLL